MTTSHLKNRIPAAAGTLIFHALLLVILLSCFLRYNPDDNAARQWPPADSSEILLGGEYVIIGNDPDVNHTSPAVEQSGDPSDQPPGADAITPDMADAGVAAPAPAPVTSSRPSPATVPAKEKPDKTGPATDKPADRQSARRRETARDINSQMAGAFSGKPAASPSAGSPDGNSTSGAAVVGVPGADLGGRTLAHWVKARGSGTGVITVDVVVDQSGRVTAASYNPGRSKGSVAASTAARQSCIAAARQCRFSVSTATTTSQRGTISFNFK